MTSKFYFIFILLYALFCGAAWGQNYIKIASLKKELKAAKSDTSKARLLCTLWGNYLLYKPDTALTYAKAALAAAQKSGDKKSIAECGNALGLSYDDIGAYDRAISLYLQSNKIYQSLNDELGLAMTLNNIAQDYRNIGRYSEALSSLQKCRTIYEKLGQKEKVADAIISIGDVYYRQGDYPGALMFFHESLRIYENIQNTEGLRSNFFEIGAVYEVQGDEKAALVYYEKSLKICESLGDLKGQAHVLSAIGNVFQKKSNYVEALARYQKCLAIYESFGATNEVGVELSNIGSVYFQQGDTPKALDYFQRSLKIVETVRDNEETSSVLRYLAEIYFRQSNLKAARLYLRRAADLALKIGAKDLIQKSYLLEFQIDSAAGDFASALKNYKLSVAYKDSLFNEEKTKEIGKLEGKYEIEKAQEIEKQKEEALKKETQRQNNLQYLLIFGGVAVFFLGLFFIGRLKLPLIISEGIIFLAFLMLFEYILIVTEPFLDKYTGGVPVQKLGLNIVLAGIFTPLHRFLEGRLKKRIIRKEDELNG